MGNRCVLDASAILAFINDEPGADKVQDALLSGAVVSTVNLCEVVGKLIEVGMSLGEVIQVISPLGLRSESFSLSQAFEAGFLRRDTKRAGLSLGDRACVALAISLGLPIVTADRAWLQVDIPVEVKLVRK